MPAPVAEQLVSLAEGFLRAGGCSGEDVPALAAAAADTIAQALALFLAAAVVLPGAAAVADPLTGIGVVAGPGRLMPPPAGGPGAGQIEPLAEGVLSARGIAGENAANLAQAWAVIMAQGILLFTAQTVVMPGIAVAGFVSASPGVLMPVPLAAQLTPIAAGLVLQAGLQGEDAAALGKAFAQAVDAGLTMFAGQAMVLPGVPAPPGATAGPGRLA